MKHRHEPFFLPQDRDHVPFIFLLETHTCASAVFSHRRQPLLGMTMEKMSPGRMLGALLPLDLCWGPGSSSIPFPQFVEINSLSSSRTKTWRQFPFSRSFLLARWFGKRLGSLFCRLSDTSAAFSPTASCFERPIPPPQKASRVRFLTLFIDHLGLGPFFTPEFRYSFFFGVTLSSVPDRLRRYGRRLCQKEFPSSLP